MCIRDRYKGRCWVISSEHIEAEKNSAIYYPQDNPDRLDFDTMVELNREIRNGDIATA